MSDGAVERERDGRGAQLETAVVVVTDVPALTAVYRDSYPLLAGLGIPLHVTLLHPFVAPDELDAALPRLRAALAGHERFDFSLERLRTFPRAVWVAPEPAEPFRALTAAIHAAFPLHPPYAGKYPDVIPHVTLAYVEEAQLASTLAALRTRVEPLLPVAVTAREVTVLAERADGRWFAAARLPLRPRVDAAGS